MSAWVGSSWLGDAQLGSLTDAYTPGAGGGGSVSQAQSQPGWAWPGDLWLGSTAALRPSFVLAPLTVAATGTQHITATGSGTAWTSSNPWSIANGAASGVTNYVFTNAEKSEFDVTIGSLGGSISFTDGSYARPILAVLPQLSLSLSSSHGRAGTAVTVTVSITNSAPGDTTVTLAADVAGTWSSTSATLNTGALSAERTFTPSVTGAVSITATGNNSAASATPAGYYSDGLTYYVSAAGSDSANGQTTLTPHATAAGVLAYMGGTWLRGSTVNFNGGDTFTGTTITVADSNLGISLSDLITFQSYGTGQAQIDQAASSTANVVVVTNSGGVKIHDLKIRGGGGTPGTSTQACVVIHGTSGTWRNFSVTDCEISHAQYGILVFPGVGTIASNCLAPVFTGNTIHDIWAAGLALTSSSALETSGHLTINPTIDNNTFYNIDGATGVGAAGQSVACFMLCVSGGTFSGNLVRDIAATAAVGGGAFVSVNADGITVASNEIYNCHGPVGQDGSGIDIDWGSTNCVVEYNYVHDCSGGGLVCFEFGSGARPVGAPVWNGNTFRYNVVQNCAEDDWGSFLMIGDSLTDARVYNNTFIHTAGGGNRLVYAYSNVTNVSGFKFLNNIFLGSSSAVTLIDIASGLSGTTAADFEFRNNVMYTNSGSEAIIYPSGTYSSVSAWAAANSSTVSGNIHSDPALSDAFTAVVFDDAAAITGLTKANPGSGSPTVNAGLDLTSSPYSYTGITRDFASRTIPRGAFDIGAVEYVATGSARALLSPLAGSSSLLGALIT